MPTDTQERTFLLHGLRVRTVLPLKGAEVADAADVVISYAEEPLDAPLPAAFTTRWVRRRGRAQLAFEADNGHRLIFTFTRRASRVDILCTLAESAETVAAILVGPAFAALLSLRGAMVLHAAAVIVQARAVLILGASGRGKSTLAAALVAAGALFLSEEVVAVRRRRAGFGIGPGHPRIALTPASASVLGRSPDLPLVYPARPGADKRWLDVGESSRLNRRAITIGLVYVLGERTTAVRPAVTPLPPIESLPALLGSLYARSGIDPAGYMRCAAQMVASVPVCGLRLPDSLEHLPHAAEAVIADAVSRLRP